MAGIPLELRAAAELELRKRRAERAEIAALPLLDFVPAVSPMFDRPSHLAPFAAELERIEAGPVRVACHTPPRHGKSELLIHYIVRRLMRSPERRIGYATYSSDLAVAKSNRARRLAREMGVEITTDRGEEWRTSAGGGVLARGVGGGWGGRGLDDLIVDDPIKDRVEAESVTTRRRIFEWFCDVAYPRLQPTGSAVVNMARWHEKDLTGRLIDENEDSVPTFKYIRLPAVCDSLDDLLGREMGDPLWPERWTADLLADRMRNKLTAASLYQGRPRPRGEAVFEGVHYYNELPESGFGAGIGLDFAYTKKTSADSSVAVAGLLHHDLFYVVEVLREQVKAPIFMKMLSSFKERHYGVPRIYIGGGAESGIADFIESSERLGIKAINAVGDKLVRAQNVATAWNEGRVLLPRSAPWLVDFIDEVCSFTGVNDYHDDQVDALAAAFDEAEAANVSFDYRQVTPRRYSKERRGWA